MKTQFPTHVSDNHSQSLTHVYRAPIRSGSSQRGSRRVVPQITLPKKGRRLHRLRNDIWAIIHTFSRNLSTCAIPPFVANIQDCNLCTLLRTRQLAHSPEGSEPLTLQLAHSRPLPLNRKMKKYTPTPIAAELFPNFISGTDTVRRPELFEQFCVPIKNSWLLFSWNYLRKSKNWMSFEDLECGVRRPANLHLPLKSLVGHWVINIF